MCARGSGDHGSTQVSPHEGPSSPLPLREGRRARRVRGPPARGSWGATRAILTKVYAKLGVTARTQLVRALRADEALGDVAQD